MFVNMHGIYLYDRDGNLLGEERMTEVQEVQVESTLSARMGSALNLALTKAAQVSLQHLPSARV